LVRDMKQILLFSIIFGLNDCGPKIDDVHVHIDMGEVGGTRTKTSPESDFPGKQEGDKCGENVWNQDYRKCADGLTCVRDPHNFDSLGVCMGTDDARKKMTCFSSDVVKMFEENRLWREAVEYYKELKDVLIPKLLDWNKRWDDYMDYLLDKAPQMPRAEDMKSLAKFLDLTPDELRRRFRRRRRTRKEDLYWKFSSDRGVINRLLRSGSEVINICPPFVPPDLTTEWK